MPDSPPTTRGAPGSLVLLYARVGPAVTGAALLLASGAIAGCASPDGDTAADVAVEAVSSPAAPGSGEPFLSTRGDTVFLSWLQPVASGGHALQVSRRVDGDWSDPVAVTSRDDLFVNWADFPSVVPGADGTLWAHWLQRGPQGGYDYGIRVVASPDGGATWSEPFTPHEDGTPQEHGFVSIFPVDGGTGMVWLDGRGYERGPDGGPPTEQMALRFRPLEARAGGPPGPAGPEEVVDARTCDCCQTAAAATSEGPVVVYRDRSSEEIRDILVTRRIGGAWTEPVPVARDGWEIEACPVNGPAVAARDEEVVVAWFTAAGGEPRVKVARSRDAGATFGSPVTVDDGNPAGRVDVLLLPDGGALVSWIERSGGDDAQVRMRLVDGAGTPSGSWPVTGASAARSSGFPRMVPLSDSRVLLAWTHVGESGETDVRLAEVNLP